MRLSHKSHRHLHKQQLANETNIPNSSLSSFRATVTKRTKRTTPLEGSFAFALFAGGSCYASSSASTNQKWSFMSISRDWMYFGFATFSSLLYAIRLAAAGSLLSSAG